MRKLIIKLPMRVFRMSDRVPDDQGNLEKNEEPKSDAPTADNHYWARRIEAAHEEGFKFGVRLTKNNHAEELADALRAERNKHNAPDYKTKTSHSSMPQSIPRDTVRAALQDVEPTWDNEWSMCNRCDFQPEDGTSNCICTYNNKLRATLRKELLGED